MAAATFPSLPIHTDASYAKDHSRAAAQALPAGFPVQLDAKLAWTGMDFANKSDYIYTLSEAEVGEVNSALQTFKALEIDGDFIDAENFPLPSLSGQLQRLSRDIYDRGFSVIRGINPEAYSAEDLTMVYLGIQAHVAEQRGRQDKMGNVLVHIVADNSSKDVACHHRHSSKSITFHNEEAGDIISWLTRTTAAVGGRCIIASAYTVYNVLANTRPDIVRTLARGDWPFAMPRFHCRPIMYHGESKLIMNFGRAALLGNELYPRSKDLPALSRAQIEALDAIENIAQATQLEITTCAGDIHFINNLAVLHRREGFTDGVSSSERRHLVRMRLRSTELGWKIPQQLRQEWDDAFEKPGNKIYHVDPMPIKYFPISRNPN